MVKQFIKDNYSHLPEDVETRGTICHCGRPEGSCRLYLRKFDGLILFDCKSASCEVGKGAVRESGSAFMRTFSPKTRLEATPVNSLGLPEGYVPNVPKKALKWLLENGVEESDIVPYKIGYDVVYERIVFPSFLDGKLNTWVARDWQGIHRAKWMTPEKIKHSPVFEAIMPDNRGELGVIVEDIPSAIRTGKHYPCWALLGTDLNQERMSTLLKRMRAVGVKRVCIALDDDADKKALEMIKRLTSVGIYAYIKKKQLGKDPKHMTTEELKEIV